MHTRISDLKHFPSDGSNPVGRLVKVDLNADALTALQLMAHHHIHHLVVTEGAQIVGIVSDRDLLFGMLRSTQDKLLKPLDFFVSGAVRKDLPCITENTTLEEALKWMQTHELSALLTSHEKEVTGLVTDSDLLNALGTYLQKREWLKELLQESEVAISSPLVQKLMRTLADMGL